MDSRFQWPSGLRLSSAAARLLRLWVRIAPGAWIFVCCECCVLSGRGVCDKLITRPEESYRVWWVIVCKPETSLATRPWSIRGCCAKRKREGSLGKKWYKLQKLLILYKYFLYNNKRKALRYQSQHNCVYIYIYIYIYICVCVCVCVFTFLQPAWWWICLVVTCSWYVNPLETKCKLNYTYLKTQFVPRSEHSPSGF